jgi:Flp pilus assembly protein TadD
VPQGVLLRLEEPGYQATEEDVTRHLELMRAFAPAAADSMPRLDTLSRDWWSGRHQVLGEAWARLGVAGAAEVEFRAATRLNPKRVQTWVALGTFYGTLGNWPAAEGAWRRALEQRPREAFFRFHLAKTLVPQGRHAEAEEWLPPRPPADVEEADFLLLRAAVHLNLERPAQAEADVLEAIERNPESARAHNDLGVVRMRRGDPLAARASFLRAVDIDSTLAEAWANAGSLAFQDGEYERASDYLARAIEAGSFNPQVGYLLGAARMRTGDLNGAEEVLRRNRALWPRHPDTYITLGLVLEASGRRQEAESIYEAGRMAMPEDPRFGQQLRRLRAIPPE